MMDEIINEAQYNQAVTLIEELLNKATNNGGFVSLSLADKAELDHVSKLAEHYEDNFLKIMPLPVKCPSVL